MQVRLNRKWSRKDVVTPYDSVNFANGVGTYRRGWYSDDGTTGTVRINSFLGITDKAGNQLVLGKDGKYYKPSELKSRTESRKMGLFLLKRKIY